MEAELFLGELQMHALVLYYLELTMNILEDALGKIMLVMLCIIQAIIQIRLPVVWETEVRTILLYQVIQLLLEAVAVGMGVGLIAILQAVVAQVMF